MKQVRHCGPKIDEKGNKIDKNQQRKQDGPNIRDLSFV